MSKAKFLHQCCEQVREDTVWPRYHQCTRAGKVNRDCKWYCKQHDPVVAQEKRAARDAKWRAEQDAERKKHESVIRQQLAMRGLLSACQQIVCYGNTHRLEDELAELVSDLRMSMAELKAATITEETK